MPKTIVHEITDALPAADICKRLGVKERSIRAAREAGRFPASWFAEIKALCADHGLACPEDAFNWKGSSAAPRVEAAE